MRHLLEGDAQMEKRLLEEEEEEEAFFHLKTLLLKTVLLKNCHEF